MRMVLLVAVALLSCQRSKATPFPRFPRSRPSHAYRCHGLERRPVAWEDGPRSGIEINADELSVCDSFIAEVIDVSEGVATNGAPAALDLRIIEPLLGGEVGEVRRAVFKPELATGNCLLGRAAEEARFSKMPAPIPLIGSRYIVSGGWTPGKRWFVAPGWAAVPYTKDRWLTWKAAVEKAMAQVPDLARARAAAEVEVLNAPLDAGAR